MKNIYVTDDTLCKYQIKATVIIIFLFFSFLYNVIVL